MRVFAALLLVLLVATGCSGAGTEAEGGTATSPSGTTGGGTEESTDLAPKTSQEPETTSKTPNSLQLRQVSSGSDGLKRRQVIAAPSADGLSEATGVRLPDAGEGTYLAAFWGEKPTGGYTVEVLSARVKGDQTVVQLTLKKPPPDAMVGQALTYPYAAAVIRGSVPKNTGFTFATQGGRGLNWPVKRV